MRLTAVLAAVLSLAACGGDHSLSAVERRLEGEGLPHVVVRARLQPDHRAQSARYLDAAENSLKALDRWSLLGDTREVTIVDPPWHVRGDGTRGAEILMERTPWWTTPTAMAPELAVARALGRWALASSMDTGALPPWFVDGVSEYSARRVVVDLFARDNNSPGFAFAEARHFGRFVPQFIRIRLLPESDADPLPSYRRNPSADVAGPHADRASLAAKTVLVFVTLDRWLSPPVLDAIMSEFATAFRGRRPTLADFGRTASAVSGQDLSWLFVQTFGGSSVFDYGIAELASRPSAAGAFDTTVTVARYGDGLFTGATAPRIGSFESGRGVTLLVSFADGEQVRESWDGRDPRKTFRYRSAARAVSAVVDPDRVVALDLWRRNNSRTLEPQTSVAATRWAARWLVWLEHWLLTYSALV